MSKKMQVGKTNIKVQYGWIPISISLMVAIFAHQYISAQQNYQRLFLLANLLILLFPFAWQKIPAERSVSPLKASPNALHLFSKIALIQTGMFILFWIWQAGFQSLTPLSFPLLGSEVFTAINKWGLFPWTFFSLAAVGFTYLHAQQREMTQGALMEPVLPRWLPHFKMFFDATNRVLMICGPLNCILFVSVVATLNGIFTLFDMPYLLGIRGELLLLFVLLVAYPISEKQLFKIEKNYFPKPTFGIWMSCLFVFVCVVVLLTHLLVVYSTHIEPLAKEYFLRYFYISAPQAVLPIIPFVVWFWWIGWVRMYGGIIAQYSQGHYLGTVVLANLALPAIVYGVLSFYPETVSYLDSFSQLSAHPYLLAVLTLCTTGFLLYQCHRVPLVERLIFCGELDASEKLEAPRKTMVYRFLVTTLHFIPIFSGGIDCCYLLCFIGMLSYLFWTLCLLLLPVILFISFYGQKHALKAAK